MRAPIAGATLDCWQNATAGFYAVQQPGVQSAENLRGIFTTDADGTYEIRTVRPVPYPIPSDGPAGDLLLCRIMRSCGQETVSDDVVIYLSGFRRLSYVTMRL